MRLLRAQDVPRATLLSAQFPQAHGAPITVGPGFLEDYIRECRGREALCLLPQSLNVRASLKIISIWIECLPRID